MITERKIDGFDASGNRAEWELSALKKNGFDDIEVIDEFDEKDVSKLSNNLIHAQQHSGRFLKNNLQRTWSYREDEVNDKCILILDEKPIGKYNSAQMNFQKTTK